MSGILTVCDANVCRSVAAELLLVEQFSRHLAAAGIQVQSRGAQALPAHSACRLVEDLRDDEAWRSRARRHQSAQLDVAAIEAADLILTATTSTRAAVVSLVPSARRRVFTLREAVSSASGFRPATGAAGDDLVRDFTAHLDARRGLQQLPKTRASRWRRSSHPFDIADGHTGGHRAHVEAVAQVQKAVSQLVAAMTADPTLPFLPGGGR